MDNKRVQLTIDVTPEHHAHAKGGQHRHLHTF